MTSTPQANGVHFSASTTARPSPTPASRMQSFANPSQPQSANTTFNSNSQPAASITAGDPNAPPSSTPRPHDARTIHLILASLGVTAYQQRVPLQLLDFAYRYTAGILGDAAHLAAEGYTTSDSTTTGASGRGKNKQTNEGDVTLPALRLATSSRLGYQFASSLPKQALLEVAEERNRIRLPDVSKTKVFGVRLPEERFLLTGRDWGIMEDEREDGRDSGASSQTAGREDAEAAGNVKDEIMGEDGDGEEDEGAENGEDANGSSHKMEDA